MRQAIKYMVKDRRYDFIETGSLLSIKKNIQGITLPSEETRLLKIDSWMQRCILINEW